MNPFSLLENFILLNDVMNRELYLALILNASSWYKYGAFDWIYRLTRSSFNSWRTIQDSSLSPAAIRVKSIRSFLNKKMRLKPNKEFPTSHIISCSKFSLRTITWVFVRIKKLLFWSEKEHRWEWWTVSSKTKLKKWWSICSFFIDQLNPESSRRRSERPVSETSREKAPIGWTFN